MIFNRTYNLLSSKTPETLKSNLLGQHLKLHDLDFEVMEKENRIKIIPHAEEKQGVLTLPIANIFFTEKNSKTKVRIETHPRRIDIGGPYILLLLCGAIFFSGFFLSLYGGEDFVSSSKVMMAIGFIVTVTFWTRMEFGYFDYVRKIKNFVKTKL